MRGSTFCSRLGAFFGGLLARRLLGRVVAARRALPLLRVAGFAPRRGASGGGRAGLLFGHFLGSCWPLFGLARSLALRLDWPCARAVQIFEPQALSIGLVGSAHARAAPVAVLGVRFHAPKPALDFDRDYVRGARSAEAAKRRVGASQGSLSREIGSVLPWIRSFSESAARGLARRPGARLEHAIDAWNPNENNIDIKIPPRTATPRPRARRRPRRSASGG